MTPKVETFEHDIANEIRRKEATLAEIQAVANHNNSAYSLPQKKAPILLIILVTLLVIALGGIGGLAYYYFTDPLLPPSSKSVTVNESNIPKMLVEVAKISPTLGAEIGRFVSLVEKKDKGYILSINSYSVVFAYMTRNETAYIDELLALFSGNVATSSSTQQIVTISTTTLQRSTTTPTTSTSTSTSTKQFMRVTSKKVTPKTPPKTIITASSSEKITEKELASIPLESLPTSNFSDVTVDNQNMRVYKKNNKTVIYAFVGDTTILISDTPEGIIQLRSAILKK